MSACGTLNGRSQLQRLGHDTFANPTVGAQHDSVSRYARDGRSEADG